MILDFELPLSFSKFNLGQMSIVHPTNLLYVIFKTLYLM